MWVIYLEIAVVLVLLVLIVWWTWPKKKDGKIADERRRDDQ